MKLIKRITDEDISCGSPVVMDSVSRYASRGVLIDHERNVAMMYMSKRSLYKLPGGGVEEGEDIEAAFLREIKEETGFHSEIIHRLGYIEEHKKRNDFLQVSYCFIAKASAGAGHTALSVKELELGMTLRWMKLDEALAEMNDAASHCDDYSTKFMLLRDKTILELARGAL